MQHFQMQVMGLAFLFVLDEASAAGHVGERTAKSADAAANAIVAADSAAGGFEVREAVAELGRCKPM